MLAYASLRYQPEVPFLRAYYSAMAARLPLADDRDLATFAQATALLDRLAKQDFMHVGGSVVGKGGGAEGVIGVWEA